jgi:hypothetical protein
MIENSGDPSMNEDSASTVDNVEPRRPWQWPVIEYFNLKYAMGDPDVIGFDGIAGSASPAS